jgi:hypothetical protein
VQRRAVVVFKLEARVSCPFALPVEPDRRLEEVPVGQHRRLSTQLPHRHGLVEGRRQLRLALRLYVGQDQLDLPGRQRLFRRADHRAVDVVAVGQSGPGHGQQDPACGQ